MVNKQDYLNAITQNIEMVRGDTLAFDFQLSGLGSRAAYEDMGVTLAVAEHYEDESLIELSNGYGIELEDYNAVTDTATYSVILSPNQTKTLDLARYYYDLQIQDSDNVITLMRGRLTLLWDVAD